MTADVSTVANIINGANEIGSSDYVRQILNPSTGQVIAQLHDSTCEDGDRAVAAAVAAFPAWSGLTPTDRSEILHRLANLAETHLDELADLETLDAGKPTTPTRAGEVPGIIKALRYFAGAGRSFHAAAAGEFTEGTTSYVRREPLGVVLGILPWNFPLAQAVNKIAPALLAGNTVVIKPAELTPLTTTRFIELAQQVLPPGVLNLVHGEGALLGDHLVRHPDVKLVSFTGSTRAGRSIASAAGHAPKRLVLELGGNAPVIIFNDTDLDAAMPILTNGIVFNAGQECMSATRILVAEDIHDTFVDKLSAHLAATPIGDAADPNTVLGPMISESQRARLEKLLAEMPAHGHIATGGKVIEGPGFFFEPTLITGVDQNDDVVQEELFGPVATVQTFTDEHDAVRKANSVDHALAASVWTGNIGRALRMVNAIEAGVVWVNNHMVASPENALGGFKGSGYGKEGGVAGVEEFTQAKQVIIDLG